MRKVCVLLALCVFATFVVGDAFAQVKQPGEWAMPKKLTVKGTSNLIGAVKFTPTDTEDTEAGEGTVYYDLSESALRVYDGSSWATLTPTILSGGTLDAAYDAGGAGSGRRIYATDGPMLITSTDTDSAFLLSLTPTPGTSAALGGLVVTSGSQSSEDSIQINNSGTGNDIQGTSSNWTITKAGAATFVSTVSPTVQITTLLNVDEEIDIDFSVNDQELRIDSTANDYAAGSGILEIYDDSAGQTNASYLLRLIREADEDTEDHFILCEDDSTGVDNDGTTMFSVDSGGAVTIAGTIAGAGDVTLDDGDGASPSLTFKDATNETAVFSKVDSDVLSLTTVAADGLRILVGNVWIGNDNPGTNPMNGEDLYVEGDVEIGGTLTTTGTWTLNGALDVNEAVDVDMSTNAQEVDFTTSATNYAGDSAIVTIYASGAGQDSNTYLLRLRHFADGDSEDDFLICEDNDGEDKFSISSEGAVIATSVNITVLLDVDEEIDIDFDSNDEEISIVSTAADYATGSGILTIYDDSTGQSNTSYLARFVREANADTQDGFILCEDNSATGAAADGDAMFTVGSGGAVTAAGTITGAGLIVGATIQATELLDVDEAIDVDFNANDEEFRIDSAANDYAAGSGIFEIYDDSTGQTNSSYLLRLMREASGDAEDHFILCEDNSTGADNDGTTIFSVDSGGAVLIAGQLTQNGNIVRASGTTETLNSDYQTEIQSIAFDIEETTMDNDDGTGIKVASITLNHNAYVIRAFVNFSSGHSDVGDTCELIINDTDDITSPTTTLDAAQDQSASEGLLYYAAAGSTTVPIAQTDTTNKYIVVVYKDVGNDGSTSSNLQGTLVVEYIRF